MLTEHRPFCSNASESLDYSHGIGDCVKEKCYLKYCIHIFRWRYPIRDSHPSPHQSYRTAFTIQPANAKRLQKCEVSKRHVANTTMRDSDNAEERTYAEIKTRESNVPKPKIQQGIQRRNGV
jgi:hypothetical protein